MPELMRQGQFCELMGVSKGRGSQWKKAGLLVFNADGLVMVDESRALLDSRLDMQKRAAAAVVPTGTRQIELPSPDRPAAKTSEERDTFAAFNKARAEKEQELAISARLDRQEREGELVSRDATYRAIVGAAAISASMLANVPDRYAQSLAAETSVDRVHEMLSDAMREVSAAIAAAVRDLAAAEKAT